MQYLISVFYFIGVLSVLVIVHEWGHFIAARLCGMRVDDFSLFFGKKLFSLGVRNGTEYNIRSIPLGGFVKIAGMEPDDISNGVPIRAAIASRKMKKKSLIGLDMKALEDIDPEKISAKVYEAVYSRINDEGHLTLSEVEDLKQLLLSPDLTEEEHRYLEAVLNTLEFQPDPSLYNQKPIWQRAFAIFAGPFMSLLFGYLLFCAMGVTTGLPTGVDNKIQVLVKGKPAEKAGLKVEDRIIAVNGVQIADGEQLVDIIHKSTQGTPLKILVQRGDQQIPFSVTPYTDNLSGKPVGRLGFAPGDRWKGYSLTESFAMGNKIFMAQVTGILQTFSKPKEMKESVGGPIAIAGIIHEGGRQGFNHILLLAASLSLSLGVLNLIPIPILDGGHLLLLGIEAIRRRKLSSNETYAAQLFGLSVIGMLFIFVMYNDLSRLWKH